MKYRVRNKDGGGELEFPTILEVERAWVTGFIDPDDDVLNLETNVWQKAKDVPVLKRSARDSNFAFERAWLLWILVPLVMGGSALWLLSRRDLPHQAAGAAIAAVLAVGLIQFTTKLRAKRK